MVDITDFNSLGFGSGIEKFTSRTAQSTETPTIQQTQQIQSPQTNPLKQPEADTFELLGRIEDFKIRLNNNPNWSTSYNKKDETLVLKSNDKKDETHYIIDKNGTVTLFEDEDEPVTIMKNSNEMAKLVANKGVENSDKKPKDSFIKRAFGGVWKFFSAFGAMAAATAKGIFYGATTGTTVLAGAWLVNVLPKVFKAEGPKFVEIVKQPLSHMGKTGKILAGVSALGVLAYHLIVGKFAANQNTAIIDHKLNIGHREE